MKTLQRLLVFALIFFLLVNTSYFWEGKLFGLSLLVFLILAITYVVLVIIAVVQVVLVIKERFKNRPRNIVFATLLVVVALVAIFPRGIIRYDLFESEILLMAQREGVANCTINLKLRKNNTYTLKEVCFGISDKSGSYEVRNDTIFFESETYDYGTIKDRVITIRLKSSASDTIFLPVVANKLLKQ
ncbi:hypothetical protein [Flavobacterium psychrotrophum]|uniref:hypothetical protein n=1 Tax=Flavobacterium psychrotrophum TaxID=2294119 RepID=UPI000E31B18C|nr:hypothetical protein [Flavobacterium psychrotrophum]